MMAVSCTKAMLVILFFMHVMYEANWKFVLTIPAALMSIFLILMLVPDVGLRGRTASEERRYHMAEERSPHHQAAQEKAADEQPVEHLSPEK
jgi:cytochrome c oxidase subunit 4